MNFSISVLHVVVGCVLGVTIPWIVFGQEPEALENSQRHDVTNMIGKF